MCWTYSYSIKIYPVWVVLCWLFFWFFFQVNSLVGFGKRNEYVIFEMQQIALENREYFSF